MEFDVDAARQDGISDDIIMSELMSNTDIANEFDFETAQKDGLTSTQIVDIYKQGRPNSNESLDKQILESQAYQEAHTPTPDEVKEQIDWTRVDEEGNVVAPTEEQLNTLHEANMNKKTNTDFGKGYDSSIMGVIQSGVDLAGWLGADTENMDAYTQKTIATLNDEIKDKDFFSMGTLGKITPSLVTLPVSYQSKLAAGLIEGALGYSEARGSGYGQLGSAGLGLLAGGGTVGIMKLIESLGPMAAKGTYNYYKKQLNYTDEEAEQVFENWSKTMETDGSYKDKLRALVDHSGSKGAQIKADIGKLSPSAQATIDAGRTDRLRNMKELANTDVTVEDIATNLKKQINIVSDNYGKVKWEIQNVKAKPIDFDIPEAVEEIATNRAAVKELLGNKDATVHDLIEAMPHVNEILRSVKGKNLHEWTKVKNMVNSKLQQSLKVEDYAKWVEVNNDYSQAMTIRKSKIGEALERALGKMGKKSQITPQRVLELIKADKDSGYETFKSMQHILGKTDAGKLEQLIIKDVMAGHADSLSWEAISKSLHSKGFISEEGKQFQEVIDNIAKSFKTDDVLRTISARYAQDEGGIGKNILEKFQVSLAGKIFRMIMKMGPTESAKALRMADRLAAILKRPSKMKDINKAVNELGEGVKARLVQETIDELPKLLEYKPQSPKYATTTNKPLYVTPKGQAVEATDVSAAMQSDDLIKWIKEAKLNDLESNKVIDSVYKVIDNKRIDTILKRASNRLKVDDMKYNEKVLDNVIRNEAKVMSRLITKDSGVKLSEVDNEKLVHYLYKKYAEEGCK